MMPCGSACFCPQIMLRSFFWLKHHWQYIRTGMYWLLSRQLLHQSISFLSKWSQQALLVQNLDIRNFTLSSNHKINIYLGCPSWLIIDGWIMNTLQQGLPKSGIVVQRKFNRLPQWERSSNQWNERAHKKRFHKLTYLGMKELHIKRCRVVKGY